MFNEKGNKKGIPSSHAASVRLLGRQGHKLLKLSFNTKILCRKRILASHNNKYNKQLQQAR